MKTLVYVFVLAVCGAASTTLTAAEAPPNILFILTDDQGWSSLGCYGNKLVPTPCLDRLAAEGARFTDAYVMPQCTPTRAALLTGQHTARTRMWHVLSWYGYPWAPVREPAFREGLPREWFTLPKGLRAAGYTTGMAGKWHLTSNEDGNYSALKAADAYGFDYVAPPGDKSDNEKDKVVDHLTDETIGFIRKHRDRPWFFYLAHHTLHGKVIAPEALVARRLAQSAPATGLNNATYLAAIEHMDTSIGRLLGALDELQLRERTLVVFLSDNGGVSHSYNHQPTVAKGLAGTQLKVDQREFSNAPLRGPKGSPYEGGIRVPCLVRWPGVVTAGRTVSTPIHVVDWLPTLLEVAGSPIKKPQAKAPPIVAPQPEDARADVKLDGLSLVPLLRGGGLTERALFWHVPLYDLRWAATPSAIVRRGDWKLIEHFGDRFDAEGRYVPGKHVELFNLREDLAETQNLAQREPARTAALVAELHKFLADCQAEVPGANPHHDPSRAFEETRTKPDFLKSP